MFTVYWEVNDGRHGYPNIVADLDWTDQFCRSYEKAIRQHAADKGIEGQIYIHDTGDKGKIRGRNYGDFEVEYPAKDGTGTIRKTIRVYGHYPE